MPPTVADMRPPRASWSCGERDVSSTAFAVYDVRTPTARRTAERRLHEAGETQDLTFTADGKNVILASGSPYYHQVLRTSDLADAGRYPAAAYSNAVAVAADGAVAAGVDSRYGSDVFMFKPGASLSHGVFEFASGDSSPLLLPMRPWVGAGQPPPLCRHPGGASGRSGHPAGADHSRQGRHRGCAAHPLHDSLRYPLPHWPSRLGPTLPRSAPPPP